ncbi:MAG: dUTP diphosphatase [Candidatus Shapirobacteria bacterium]|jgi:dUTP pyrophosphatase
MKIKIKRFDKNIPLPLYKTEGAACLDLYSRTETKILPHTVGFIPLNVALSIPKGYWVMIAARGSTHKFGIMPVHGIGIGDWDFRGDNNEYLFPALNFTDKEVTIEKGTRIAQMMISKVEKVEITEVNKLEDKDRGKFGSTGEK